MVRLARLAGARTRTNFTQFPGEKSFYKCRLVVHPQFTRKSPPVHCGFPGVGPKCAQLDSEAITKAAEHLRRKRRKSMTKQILTVAAALVFTALAPTQSHAQQVTQAKVPFAFQVANTTMPAGEYQIRRPLQSSKEVQQIRRADLSASAFVIAIPTGSTNKGAGPRLIFHCYSNECFLSEIWAANGEGMKIVVSRGEKEVSRVSTENELAVVSVPLTVTP
jgi:hypothetical protein